MRSLRWLPAFALSLGGCVAVLDFDITEDDAATSGSGGSGPSSSGGPVGSGAVGSAQGGGDASSSVSATSQGGAGVGGGDCDGCVDGEGECRPGTDLDRCGRDGSTCEACEGGGECAVAACLAAGCDLVAFEDGIACVGGACRDGECVPGDEDCTDGVDNDHDGQTDCADTSACGSLAACIPAMPDGWLGPFAAYETAGEVACPGVWPDRVAVLHRDADESAFDCGTCTCASNCTVTVTTYTDETCADLAGSFEVSQDQCVAAFDFDIDSAQVQPSGFDCVPAVEGRVVTPASWTTTVTLCGGASFGAGCAGQCASRPPPLGDAVHVCVAKEAGGPCPAGFGVSRPAFAGAVPLDERACDPCTCADPQGGCMGAIAAFTDDDCTECSGAPGPCRELGLGCIDLSSAPNQVHARYEPAKQCTPSGGAESGSVSGSEPWAVCCID